MKIFELKESVIEYEILKEVGIFHTSQKSAAEHLKYWTNICLVVKQKTKKQESNFVINLQIIKNI